LITPVSPKGHLLPAQQRQIFSSTQVTGLSPKTEYSLTLYAIYPGLFGESATIITETILPPVSNFRVIEEGLFSLLDRPGLIYDQILSADVSSQVIDTLEEDKEYSVDIYTIYPEGPSETVSVTGKLVMKLVALEQLLVQNATTDIVQAGWSSVRGATGYRLTWSSSENVNLGDNFNFYLVQGLNSVTGYTIIINPIFVDTEGPVTSAKAKTCECYMRTVRAFAVSSSSAVTSWNAVPGATVYRLAWGPTAGTYISSFFCLLYFKKVFKHESKIYYYLLYYFAAGPGITFCSPEPLGYISNFKVMSYSNSSIDVEWSHILAATEYKLTWSSEFVIPQSQYLVRSILKHSITGLQPQTLYSVSIHALYSNTEGPENSRQVLFTTLNLFTDHRYTEKGHSIFIYLLCCFCVLLSQDTNLMEYCDDFAVNRLSQMIFCFLHLFFHIDADIFFLMQISLFTFCVEVDISSDVLSSGFTSYKNRNLLYGRTYLFSIRPLYGDMECPVTTITKRICNALSLQISLAQPFLNIDNRMLKNVKECFLSSRLAY
uniref:Fibronectin type-III domain-containing protein n=1 Tax=Cyprinus carpio TaxID=7962 RepID=A0A8C1WLY3_CYPCA